MNRLTYIKAACIAITFIFAIVEVSINVLPYAEALTPRSFDAPVAIDEEAFPDAGFREYVKENIDEDEDGYLTPQECDSVKTIGYSEEGSWTVEDVGLKNKGITDITGVDLFTNLEAINLSYNSLERINLSWNKNLKQVDLRGNKEVSNENFSMFLPRTDGVVYVILSTDANIQGWTTNGEFVRAD